MAALYVVKNDYVDELIRRSRESGQPEGYDFGVKRDPQYLIYMVDADSFESPTGIYEIVSLGTNSSVCLRSCFDSF